MYTTGNTEKNYLTMSKMKEIDRIAEYLHEVMIEQLDDSIDWAVDGTSIDKLEGDEYMQMKNAILKRTIEYMLNYHREL
jgi:hypothetical protein